MFWGDRWEGRIVKVSYLRSDSRAINNSFIYLKDDNPVVCGELFAIIREKSYKMSV